MTPTHHRTVETRDPQTLRRHPLHKAHVPAPDKKSPEWEGFVLTVRADGRIRETVKTTKDGLVMDGWWRVEAARDLQFETVPVEVADTGEAALLIVETLTARKQMTRGAAVYLALGALADYSLAANARCLDNRLKKRETGEETIKAKAGATQLISTDHLGCRYLAERWGCAIGTVLQARAIRALFHDAKEFADFLKELDAVLPEGGLPALQKSVREEFEPLLYNGTKSLWDIKQALAGRLATKGKVKVVEQLTLFALDNTNWMDRLAEVPNTKAALRVVADSVERIEDEDHLQRIGEVAAALTQTVRERLAALRSLTVLPAKHS